MKDKVKIRVSELVSSILAHDAARFGFIKNNCANINALLNKLIPTLVLKRQLRRNAIEDILQNEYNQEEKERIYNIANTVIDRVYFNGEELNLLDDTIWYRPSNTIENTFLEIKSSETKITAQTVPEYIRGLLNEYVRLPQYKRELLAFNEEVSILEFSIRYNRILHLDDCATDSHYRVAPFNYYYGYLDEQTIYCVFYDFENDKIVTVPLRFIRNIYALKQKHALSEQIKQKLSDYCKNTQFTNYDNAQK